MKEECLYIIGNGFDLKHEIATKYSDFKRWLFEKMKNRCNRGVTKSISGSEWRRFYSLV